MIERLLLVAEVLWQIAQPFLIPAAFFLAVAFILASGITLRREARHLSDIRRSPTTSRT